MTFAVGDRVTWRSQAAGMWKEKDGEVVAVIPIGARPQMKGVGWKRDHVSYLVRAGGRLYWPRASALSLVAAGAPCPHCSGTGKAANP